MLAQHSSTCTDCAPRIAQLEQELAQALHDPIWGIATRQGVERRLTELSPDQAAIVLDLDDMHGANARFSHAGVDWRVTQVMQSIRADDTFAGRWLQGDEIVVFANAANAPGLAERLLILLEMRGMGATIAIAEATREGIAEGVARIDQAKREGRRGQIL